MKTLKALSALLTYPTQELLDALPDLYAVIVDEGAVERRCRDDLKSLMQWMQDQDLLELEAEYVAVFDRGRATSLHLFEHVHGDSRDRGQAMVDLSKMYERSGFRLAANELPDFVPAVLEFLSSRPRAEVDDMLGDCAHILRSIGETLRERGSGYSAVFAALLSVVGASGLSPDSRSELPLEEKSLDEEWAEEPVIFGPAAACGEAKPQVAPIQFHHAATRTAANDPLSLRGKERSVPSPLAGEG
jgi:nitrate reductase molybdenum cofactor assembly chaperone NarJ/NarW